MKLLVVDCAKRHREFVTDLEPQSADLRVSHVVRVRWRPSTDHAGLASDETKVLLASHPSRLADRERTLVDLPQVFPRLRLIDGVVSVAVSECDGASLEVRHQLRSDARLREVFLAEMSINRAYGFNVLLPDCEEELDILLFAHRFAQSSSKLTWLLEGCSIVSGC
jgi:hypothetical protein